VWPLLGLSVISLWEMMKSRKHRLLPITTLLLAVGLIIESWLPHGHYVAPLVCVVVATALYGLRFLRTWKPRGVPVGFAVSRAVVIVILAWSVFPLAQRMINPWLLSSGPPYQLPSELERARLEAELDRMPGQHLVIVHNRRSYTGSQDWIYNNPDIDHAKIIWARDMGPEKNEELLRYFSGRQVWLVDQNDGISRLTAYNGHSAQETVAHALTGAQTGHKN
jgi:energy-coupling factor transporter transmembrane protein EcfT